MEFLLQPGVYRTGDASTLLKLLDNMWIKDHSVGAGTLYIISGFANYNGGVRFYPYVPLFFHYLQHHSCAQLKAILKDQTVCIGLMLSHTIGVFLK